MRSAATLGWSRRSDCVVVWARAGLTKTQSATALASHMMREGFRMTGVLGAGACDAWRETHTEVGIASRRVRFQPIQARRDAARVKVGRLIAPATGLHRWPI